MSKHTRKNERGESIGKPRTKKAPEPNIASADELLARCPDEYVLYELLEYTHDAQVPRARLLGHGHDEATLLRKKKCLPPGASQGDRWVPPI